MAGNPNMVKGGPSINPRGRPRGRFRPLSDALRQELLAEPKRARRIVRRLIQMAEGGDLKAMDMIMDRTEGKAVQSIEVGEPGAFMDEDERIAKDAELQDEMNVKSKDKEEKSRALLTGFQASIAAVATVEALGEVAAQVKKAKRYMVDEHLSALRLYFDSKRDALSSAAGVI